MSFSFSSALDTPISEVRQTLGDTIDEGHLVEDETIAAYLAKMTVTAASAQLANDIAARFARDIDMDVDGNNFSKSQRYKHFKDLAARLTALAAQETVSAQAGTGSAFSGVEVFGTTAQEVVDARCDKTSATNAPLRW